MDNPSATSTEAPPKPDSSVVMDCVHQMLYGAVQKPISGVTQLIDSVAGTQLEQKTDWISQPAQADFGSARWHAEQVAGGVGAMVPFLVGAAVTRPFTKAIFEKGVLEMSAAPAGKLLERYSLGEAAVSGFAANALFEPSNGDGSLLQQRFKQGAVGAITLGSMHAGSSWLGKFTGASAAEAGIINKAFTTGIAGGGAGILGASADAWLNGRSLDIKQIGATGYAMAFTGGALSMASGNLMKLNTNRSQLPAVDEFVARNYDGSNNVEHYQAWLVKRSLSGKMRNMYDIANDGLRQKTDAMLERVGIHRPATEVESANNAKYGDLPPDGHRDLKLTLAGMSPTDRLSFVRQLERLGNDPMLNESSLSDLHQRLVEASKNWKESELPALFKAQEEARTALFQAQSETQRVQRQARGAQNDKELSEAKENEEHAISQWSQARTAFQAEITARTQQVGEAINPWLVKQGMPGLQVEHGAGEGVANYAFGQGRILISDAALIKPEFGADFFGMLFHEMVHARQDVLRVRWLADQMGINEPATAEQVAELNRRQVMPTVLLGDGERQLRNALPYTEQILAARRGEPLSPTEARQAAAIDAALKGPQPSWTKQADAIKQQQINIMNVVDFDEPYRVGHFLDDLASEPESAPEKFGFAKVPARLLQLAKARAAMGQDAWSRAEPDAPVLEEVKGILNDQMKVLQQAYRPYADKEYEQYVGSATERHAYPAGLLAYLFARSKQLKPQESKPEK